MSTHETPPVKAGLPLLALAVGAFGIGVTEFSPMGLLPVIADGVGVSIPSAGMLISAYAVSYTHLGRPPCLDRGRMAAGAAGLCVPRAGVAPAAWALGVLRGALGAPLRLRLG